MGRIKVLFAASEIAPFAKVGGLGDVIEGLPKAIAEMGHDVSIVIPKYEQIDVRKIGARVLVRDIPLLIGGTAAYVTVHHARLPRSRVRLYLLENKKYLGAGEIYFERTAFAKKSKEIQRFLFFSKAVATLLHDKILNADVVHCNDWHTGALLNFLKHDPETSGLKTVFTIHNLANQGIWNSREVNDWFGDNHFKESGGRFNLMAEGIRNADLVTTVSESYSREILTREYGAGLERLLKKRALESKLVGILNGVDYSMWPVPRRNKIKFQKMLGLAPNEKIPIFGLVARLTDQKGIPLIIPAAREFVKAGQAQFVFLGRGEPRFENLLVKLARDFPKSVYSKIGFDEELAHSIYAHSDFFLMPSIFEPSGLGQLISMHYGTIPIVRATGGLKDSVRDGGTGFVFANADSLSCKQAMNRALACYLDAERLKKLRARCRAQDFSWRRSAQKYISMYKRLSDA